MGIVGLVGGLGPESTIDYYRRLLDGWSKLDASTSPSIVIDSLDVQLALRLVANDRPALIDYLSQSVQRLAGAGADFIAMTANTPHIVFDELAARSPVPLLSIVETCADEARRRGLQRLALIGTRFTMEAPFYPEVFARRGLTIVTPTVAEIARIHERYIGQLLAGDFRDETRAEIISVIERLRRDERIEGVILGGTELPLLLRAAVVAGLPTLDTTASHVDAILARLRELDLEVAKTPLTRRRRARIDHRPQRRAGGGLSGARREPLSARPVRSRARRRRIRRRVVARDAGGLRSGALSARCAARGSARRQRGRSEAHVCRAGVSGNGSRPATARTTGA